MSEPINDGGPAFPVPDVHYPNGQIQFGSNGMTLRDYLAGQALAGMMANPHVGGDVDAAARGAYMQADAMLAARLTKPE